MAPTMLSNSMILADAIVVEENGKKISDSFTTDSKLLAKASKSSKQTPYFTITRSEIVWRNIIIFLFLHLSAFYGLYLILMGRARFLSFVLPYIYGMLGGMGITAGAHRLWAHKSYKATWQLRLILMFFNLIAFQNSIYEWVRDHRLHHKFTDTDADPHNSSRGFFFSHMGWLLVRKHPDIKRKGATIDMTDLEGDPIVMFQKKYYGYLMPTFCFIVPMLIPWYVMNETIWNSWFVAAAFRYILSLHFTWLVNSAAHIYGMRPYDKTIKPADNAIVAVLAFGEGWHNYHHVFPWDYKTSELGDYSLNLTKAFIDLFARIGWAYDLKTVSDQLIRKRAARTGDASILLSKGTMPQNQVQHPHHDDLIWGWDDKDMNIEDKNDALILN